MNQICKLCNCYMLSHPSLKGWLKCIACGFCKKSDDEVIEVAKEVMKKHAGTLKKLKDSGD